MGWATHAIGKLKCGETVTLTPHGNSMLPRIKSGQTCVVAPLEDGQPEKGDVVLCKVNGNEYLHIVKAVQGSRYQIGNNKGRINGWVGRGAIFGRLVENGR